MADSAISELARRGGVLGLAQKGTPMKSDFKVAQFDPKPAAPMTKSELQAARDWGRRHPSPYASIRNGARRTPFQAR